MTTVKTILFVENDLVSQTMYQKRLEREGYHVECARDGQVALDILSERAPDLVLLDLMLPKVSGADVLKFMQADPRLTTVPVIIFSNAPLTEVPPDSALAQGTKRLLKSDCTFPTLLGAIEDTLSNAPQLVVMEAGKTASNESIAAATNGESRRKGSATAAVAIPEPVPESPGTKHGAEFLKEAAGMMPKIREHSMGFIKAPGSDASQNHLAGLQQRIHLLNASVTQAGCARVALLTNAFDALLSLVMDKPATVTPSVLQTIAQAVDCLDSLLKNNDGYALGPSFRAKVLVVDDDTVCNHVNVTSLKRANFDPIGVKEPAAALEMLEATPFDLVVLDVNMPGMTGFDVCTKMRRLPHCKKTPVIFVTAFSNFDNRKQSVLSGGNDFVSKPVTPSELALKVTVNLIKSRVQGTHPGASDAHSSENNGNGSGSTDKSFSAGASRLNQPAKTSPEPPEPANRFTVGTGFGAKEPRTGAPLKMSKADSEHRPPSPPEHAAPSKSSPPPVPEIKGKPPTDIHERLRQSTAALESAKAGLEQESAERSRVESRWREQLSSAEALVKQTETVLKEKEARCVQLEKESALLQQTASQKETVLKEKEARCVQLEKELALLQQTASQKETVLKEKETRCGQLEKELAALQQAGAQKEAALKEKEGRCSQLEKELAGSQRAREELQGKMAAEQQSASKAQHELQDRLKQVGVELDQSRAASKKQAEERAHFEEEWQERFSAAKTAVAQLETEIAALQQTVAQKDNALKEKDNRCSQLDKELAGSQRMRDELQNKFAAEQQKIAKSQEEIKGLQGHLQKANAELERAKTAGEQESAKRAQLESECRSLTQAKDALALELRSARENSAAHESKMKDQQKKHADGLRENIRLLQLRLQETEGFAADAGKKT